jgi:signal peptide peptidase SppA
MFKNIYRLWRRREIKMHFKKNKVNNIAARLITKRLTNVPYLIDAQSIKTTLSIVNGPIGAALLIPSAEQQAKQLSFLRSKRENLVLYGRIAVISIHDNLLFHPDFIDCLFGGTSYEAIREQFQSALSDPGIDAIVFDMDSPGGEVSGCFDLADEIFNARGIKPIYAVVNEMAYSAAYTIASAADKIFLPRTGGVGSIGVICMHMDQSQHDKKIGVKYTPIIAGAHKADFNPHAPLSTDAQQLAQDETNSIYDLLVKTVARNRGIDQQVIRDTQAGLLFGKNAVDIGLADSVMSYSKVLEDLQKKNLIERVRNLPSIK